MSGFAALPRLFPFRRLLPLVAVSMILAGCTGSLARAIVEPDAGAFGAGSATFLPEDRASRPLLATPFSQ